MLGQPGSGGPQGAGSWPRRLQPQAGDGVGAQRVVLAHVDLRGGLRAVPGLVHDLVHRAHPATWSRARPHGVVPAGSVAPAVFRTRACSHG